MTTPRCEPALAGFLAAIMANPDGHERLIMADFLEERDDPRAAILREPGNWIRHPSSRNGARRQRLVWRPSLIRQGIPPRNWLALFEYRYPFPQCTGMHCLDLPSGRVRFRPGDRSWRGKWLCTPCYNGTRRVEDVSGVVSYSDMKGE